MSEFQEGDVVSYVGTIRYLDEYSGEADVQHADETYKVIPMKALTLVERPEPTYTVELTDSEIQALREGLRYVPVTVKKQPIDSAYSKLLAATR